MSSFELQNFYKKKNSNYKLLPFRFINLDQEKVIMTNMVGEFYQVNKKTVKEEKNNIEDKGLMSKVKRLKSLYNNGTLNKDEFEKAKNKLLK